MNLGMVGHGEREESKWPFGLLEAGSGFFHIMVLSDTPTVRQRPRPAHSQTLGLLFCEGSQMRSIEKYSESTELVCF